MEQILQELESINGRMATKEELLVVKSQMNHRFDTLETRTANMQQDIAEIKNNIQHIEKNQPPDIMGMLKQINSNIDKKSNDHEVSLINEKVEELESDVKLIKKVITN